MAGRSPHKQPLVQEQQQQCQPVLGASGACQRTERCTRTRSGCDCTGHVYVFEAVIAQPERNSLYAQRNLPLGLNLSRFGDTCWSGSRAAPSHWDPIGPRSLRLRERAGLLPKLAVYLRLEFHCWMTKLREGSWHGHQRLQEDLYEAAVTQAHPGPPQQVLSSFTGTHVRIC